ncbi:peptide/nickel transport system permease protein [Thermocatellispora tengchongensis]|uniref:Peptide/nickel transport system permease protein n=1 Tax=Thermocatellispora tengchongensis TaxID=1073253 RepID=A0A840P8Y8_9ACTN|nr:ABC transporter permease [Thermocatellispora tengchongensis]MBB5135459.1 peptide/nickel transport system permease protein [Thermocatellispora tengchongensis]
MTRRALFAALCAGVIVLIALAGPLLTDRSPTAQAGNALLAPSPEHPLGTDVVGRDVLARVLHGGLAVVALSAGATVLAGAAGLALGVLTGLAGRRTGELAVRAVDVLGVVPPLLVMLLLATGFPAGDLAVLVAVALVSLPFSVRVVRAATQQVAGSGFVDIARARGDGQWRILRHDIVPNILRPVLAETGLRLSASIHLTATAGFLGLGAGAPAPNWGRMVGENAVGFALTPWPFLAPALLLVVFAVSVNLLADELGRALGVRS